MSEEPKKHDHLEIHALVDGGYVIREGRFDGDMSVQRTNHAYRVDTHTPNT